MLEVSRGQEQKMVGGVVNVRTPGSREKEGYRSDYDYLKSDMLTPIPKFDAQTWFGQFTEDGSQILQDELQAVLEFTLIWNLFERKVCHRAADLRCIRRHVECAIDVSKIKEENYRPHVEYFRNRFEDPSEEFLTQVLLSSRRLPNSTDREHVRLVQSVIEGKFTDLNNVVYALLFIAYRVRNNLFHGEKTLHTLHLQKELFDTVNSYLSIYMSETLDLDVSLKIAAI